MQCASHKKYSKTYKYFFKFKMKKYIHKAGMFTILMILCRLSMVISTNQLNGQSKLCYAQRKYNRTVTVAEKMPVRVQKYEYCLSHPFRCTKYVTEIRTVIKNETYEATENIPVCCTGYQEDEENGENCFPICDPVCQNGVCVEPNKCECEDNYVGLDCSIKNTTELIGVPKSCNNTIKYNETTSRWEYRPVRVQKYEYCLSFPFRCTKYITEIQRVEINETKEGIENVPICCPGFVASGDGETCFPVKSLPYPNCQLGYTGQHCNESCKEGFFGVNCLETCKCLNGGICTNRTCTCPPGHLGSKCEKDCPPGKYGLGCEQSCNCVHASDCDPKTGKCGCYQGWTGENCSTPCSHGKFGVNCGENCECENDGICRGHDGQCICLKGWMGRKCDRRCAEGYYGDHCLQACMCQNDDHVCDPVEGCKLTSIDGDDHTNEPDFEMATEQNLPVNRSTADAV